MIYLLGIDHPDMEWRLYIEGDRSRRLEESLEIIKRFSEDFGRKQLVALRMPF